MQFAVSKPKLKEGRNYNFITGGVGWLEAGSISTCHIEIGLPFQSE